jgi:membrane protein implicated in regulation of membrane protease activity
MTHSETNAARFQVHTGMLLTGAALAGVGSLLGLAGLAISGAALADATRRWVNAMETPPSELAKQLAKAKAKAATVAGASAWRNGTGQPTEPAR